MTGSRRGVAFAVIATLIVLSAVGYVVLSSLRSPSGPGSAPLPTPVTSPVPPATDPYIAFQRTRADADFGTVGSVPMADPGATPTGTPLSCERIHMSRFGGVCLAVDRAAVTTARVLLLNSDMSVRFILSTPGIPSRARVSPDGRWAATTTFVFGHSYASTSFSTQTEIYDMQVGSSLGNLEDFAFSYQGKPYDAEDINVWGVTFADDGTTFYATVMTAGRKHLAKGDIGSRAVEMTDVEAECPSLSPSGAQLAFKSATSPSTWQVKVRDLATGAEHAVAETRSVDDQIEWLDDTNVVYGLNRASDGQPGATADVWSVPADGSGKAELFIEGAWSPAVVRVP